MQGLQAYKMLDQEESALVFHRMDLLLDQVLRILYLHMFEEHLSSS